MTPSGLDQIRQLYGDPRPYMRADGTISADWERHQLAMCELPAPLALSWDPERLVSRIRCHRVLTDVFAATFRLIYEGGLWAELREYGGCYAWRPQRGGSKLSLHAWGAAIDLNVSTNQLGEDGDMPPSIIRAFEAHGFFWGGGFSRPDPMHFQFATAY